MVEEVIELLTENYFIPIYLLTLIVSIVRYNRYYDTILKFFPILLAYTFLNELLGVIIRKYPNYSLFKNVEYSEYNFILYNIFSIFFFGFFYAVYWKLISNGKYRIWIQRMSVFVLLAYLISCFFQNPINTDLYYANAIGSWALLFCIGLYFIEKRRKKESTYQPYNLVFWISVGLFVFYTIFPILFLIGYLDYDTWEKFRFRSVLRILIVLMYSFFIIGFVFGRRREFK
ncbi:MAG: hypothetical protein KJO52_11480 [Maribacter sp.]|nr:hypothetical protein [Maribacter sp.]